MFTDNELINKKDIFDPIEDDDDIDWKHNPFDVDSVEGFEETPEQLMSQVTFEGSPQLQTKLKALVLEFIDVFATKVRREPAAVEPMKIVKDEDKWRLPCNRVPPCKHSEEKQKEIRKHVDALLKLGVIKESQATEEVTPFMSTLCYTSRLIVTTPILIPCVAQTALIVINLVNLYKRLVNMRC